MERATSGTLILPAIIARPACSTYISSGKQGINKGIGALPRDSLQRVLGDMKVTVVGSGYVGLVASACLAELGQQVICVDSDPAKIEALQRGETPIHERFLPELLARHCGTRLTFTSSLADAVQSSAVIFVAVGTPSTESGDCDLSDVEAVARELSRSVNEYKLVVQKSTVPVCTSEWMRRIMLLNGAPRTPSRSPQIRNFYARAPGLQISCSPTAS